ncbi:hypothetical protein EB796_004463 [Bugula neritina]|uniref:Peptidase M14 domain-containing protein n=1 Tax=Bugula neritina TaxID=10212 RepID=A0A7J7KID8_BUGNE|nr:hypothetical protein EB796_004463 [Bugula neritina]
MRLPLYILLYLLVTSVTYSVTKRLELTLVDLKKINDESLVKKMMYMVHSLDNPKVDIRLSKRTHSLIIETEDPRLLSLITYRFKTELNIPPEALTTRQLPEVKVKNTYRLHKRSLGEFDITAYNSHESVNDYLDELSISYPDLVTTKIIGYTHQNRPIKILIINNKKSGAKPKVFIDGGQHAREWISPAVVTHMIHQLINGYYKEDDRLRSLVTKYEFHMLPILNPDGYVYSYSDHGIRLWRKNMNNVTTTNCTGVDLNRNWDFHWAGRGGSRDECSIVYQGQSAFSEKETKATSDYILSYQGQWHSYFSFHSFGQLILFPYSHTAIPNPDYEKHRSAAKSLAAGIKSVNNRRYTVGAVGMILYEASGSSESWAYSIGVPYSYTLELPDLFTFVVPTDVIEPTANELLQGLVEYFQLIEEEDPKVYKQLVANVTESLPTREDNYQTSDSLYSSERRNSQSIFLLLLLTTMWSIIYY